MSYLLPERASNLANTSLMTACDRTIASACCFLLLIRSGSFMYGPMVTGLRGATDVTVGTNGARKAWTTFQSEEISTRRFWWGGRKAGGVEAPAPRRGRAETAPRRPVLAVARDHPDVVLPFRLHRVEGLRDLGGGGDGVVPHDVVVDLLGRHRGNLVAALDDHFLRRPRSPLFRRFGPLPLLRSLFQEFMFHGDRFHVLLGLLRGDEGAELADVRAAQAPLAVLVVDPQEHHPALP